MTFASEVIQAQESQCTKASPNIFRFPEKILLVADRGLGGEGPSGYRWTPGGLRVGRRYGLLDRGLGLARAPVTGWPPGGLTRLGSGRFDGNVSRLLGA